MKRSINDYLKIEGDYSGLSPDELLEFTDAKGAEMDRSKEFFKIEAAQLYKEHPEVWPYGFLPWAARRIIRQRFVISEIKNGFRDPSWAAEKGLDYPENPDQLKYPEKLDELCRLEREENLRKEEARKSNIKI